jgi:hypothetical protein
MTIGFHARLRGADSPQGGSGPGSPYGGGEPIIELPVTARSHNYGGVPTREEIIAVCAALGHDRIGHVQTVERDAQQEITRIRTHDALGGLVGRVLLRWEHAKQEASFSVIFPVPAREMEKLYAMYPRKSRDKVHQLLAKVAWQKLYESNVREMLLRELVRQELKREAQ